jgi:hypothetical protein
MLLPIKMLIDGEKPSKLQTQFQTLNLLADIQPSNQVGFGKVVTCFYVIQHYELK